MLAWASCSRNSSRPTWCGSVTSGAGHGSPHPLAAPSRAQVPSQRRRRSTLTAPSCAWRKGVASLGEHVPMDHVVRRIKADEWRPYRELRLEAFRDSPLAFVEQYGPSLAQPDRFWRDRVERAAASAAAAMFVAVQADRFVGMAAVLIDPELALDAAHVAGVYLTPRWRGRGVADELMAAVIRWVRQDGRVDRIRLFVTKTSSRAAAFYGRIGFVYTGDTQP